MEFFIGAMSSLIGIIAFNKFVDRVQKTNSPINIIGRQSAKFQALAPALRVIAHLKPKPPLETQATKFHDSRYTTIAVVEDKAYWIENNALLVADVINGNFEKESAKRVDTMGMDKVELNKIIYIVEQLSEGTINDSGNTGKP